MLRSKAAQMRKRLRPFALQVRGKTPKQFRKRLSYLFTELYITLLTYSVKSGKNSDTVAAVENYFFIIFRFIAIFFLIPHVQKNTQVKFYAQIYGYLFILRVVY
jgi:hypothetical protein